MEAFKKNWPVYLMESFALGLFMFSAALFTVLLEAPGYPGREALPQEWMRRAGIGIAMGLTAMLNIYSPWGKVSGAHMNPSVTLTFLRLGKIRVEDALFYVFFQFGGAVAGLWAARRVLGKALSEAPVLSIVTRPGVWGEPAAFAAEFLISFLLMAVVLKSSNHSRFNRWTGVFAGALVALYILIEAPVSGMSMNPARTFASSLSAGNWQGLWIYFTAPLLGMLLAGELYAHREGFEKVFCAKLVHSPEARCLFRCSYGKIKP